MRRSFLLLVLSAAVLASAVSGLRDYHYSCYGSCDQLQPTIRGLGGTMLMGGGTDVDSAFYWFLEQANGGDVVVLRTSGNGAYNEYLYELGPAVNSVATFVLKASAGADAYVLERVANCSALFWAGGDQWTYYSWFKNSPLAAVIQRSIAGGAVYGGTSAGCAVQPQYIYTAEFDTIESSDALANPYDYQLTVGTNFPGSPLLADVITDTHFFQRDRMGRLLAFAARLATDAWTPLPLAIGVNEQSAVCIQPDGKAFLRGGADTAAAYLVTLVAGTVYCQPGDDLLLQAKVYMAAVNTSYFYDFAAAQPIAAAGTKSYLLTVKNQTIHASNGSVSVYGW